MTPTRIRPLSATNLAAHHHLQCDLFLHNAYHRASSQTTTLDGPSYLTKAQFERGNDWERKLSAWLDQNELLLTVISTAFTGDDLREVVELDDRDHFYITGLSFWAPGDALKEEYIREGETPVSFSMFKPDFIEVERTQTGAVLWKVIDAKASNGVKPSHFAQVYFYSHCLRHMLLPPFFLAADNAAIWLPPKAGFDSTDPSTSDLRTLNLSLASESMKEYLFRKIPRILNLPRESVRWHYNPLCRGCPFNSQCRSRALQEQKIGSMPNITIGDANVLENLLKASRELGACAAETEIEDLDRLIKNGPKLEELSASLPTTVRKAKRILGIPLRKSKQVTSSPILDAAKTRKVQSMNRRNFTCPYVEDIAIIISLVQDPASASIATFCISIFSELPEFSGSHVRGTQKDLVPYLASLIDQILESRTLGESAPRTQFYTFSPGEEVSLQYHLINVALTADANDPQAESDIRKCIGALSEGAALLATSFQPQVLDGALLGQSKSVLQQCLRWLGLSSNGTNEELKKRLYDALQDMGRRSPTSGNEVGKIPRVIILKREIERLLALPIPGYWDLLECASVLLPNVPKCSSDDDIFIHFKQGLYLKVEMELKRKNGCIYQILRNLRQRASELLVNTARVFSSNLMDFCRNGLLRKLFYMEQFELLTKLTELWRDRIDGCPDAPILEYRSSAQRSGTFLRNFELITGSVDPSADKDRTFYDYLLVDEENLDLSGQSDRIPPEALFHDEALLDSVFPLNRNTKYKWKEQPQDIQNRAWVVDVRDVSLQNQRANVTILAWGEHGMRFVPGRRYRLSPRLVNFNIQKVLSTLVELDLRWAASDNNVPFLQLISDPKAFAMGRSIALSRQYINTEKNIHKLFKQLQELGCEASAALMPKTSQRRALKRILSYRLAVLWGPPGTGKTYTIALSILRLLDVQNRLQTKTRRIIFLTAMTHAAIRACLGKLTHLMQCYRQIRDVPSAWLDRVHIEHVVKGTQHHGPQPNSQDAYIYAGTVYQLYNFSKRFTFEVDCVVIDEAGQLALGSAALVFRSLAPWGRVIIAGDFEQLAPIFNTQYPAVKPRLFGSLLDCMMDQLATPISDDIELTVPPDEPPDAPEADDLPSTSLSEAVSSISTIVQLTENFRLNHDLGEFISTIYSKKFESQKKSQAAALAKKLQSLKQLLRDESDAGQDVLRFLLALSAAMQRRRQNLLQKPRVTVSTQDSTHLPISLALIELGTRSSHPEEVGYDTYVRGEASVAARLVSLIQRSCPEDSIFVATPHRVQRQAVKNAIREIDKGSVEEGSDVDETLVRDLGRLELSSNKESSSSKLIIDTIERLQGSEAEFVICLFSLPNTPGSNASFLLQRRRLNVAISRAKTICILITSDSVLRPSASLLANEESARGYAFLREFRDRAWTGKIEVDLDAFKV